MRTRKSVLAVIEKWQERKSDKFGLDLQMILDFLEDLECIKEFQEKFFAIKGQEND